MLNQNRHSQCIVRDIEGHKIRVQELDNPLLPPKQSQKWSKLYGVHSVSILSEIRNFDVTKQVLFDPTHDLLEGVNTFTDRTLLK